MILFSKRAFQLVPLFLLYMLAAQFIASFPFSDTQFTTRIFTDKMYCYLTVPPFLLGASMIDGSMKKPFTIRMKSRTAALLFMLAQQYLFALLYLGAWFLLIPLFARFSGERATVSDILQIYFRYLMGLVLLAQLSGILKRADVKIFRTMPYITAYLLLLLETQAVKVVTGRFGRAVKLFFSWVFHPFGAVILPSLFIVMSIALWHFNRKYDIF